jgi:hypothetical protein
MPEVEVLPETRSVAERAIDEFVRLASEAFRTGNRFTVALEVVPLRNG